LRSFGLGTEGTEKFLPAGTASQEESENRLTNLKKKKQEPCPPEGRERHLVLCAPTRPTSIQGQKWLSTGSQREIFTHGNTANEAKLPGED